MDEMPPAGLTSTLHITAAADSVKCLCDSLCTWGGVSKAG